MSTQIQELRIHGIAIGFCFGRRNIDNAYHFYSSGQKKEQRIAP